MRPLAVLIIFVTCLGVWGTDRPADAAFNPGEMFRPENRAFTIAMWSLGSIGFSTLAYYLYKNSPAQRAQGYPEELGPGEWYVGGYTGFSFLPPADWKFDAKFSPPYAGRTAQNVTYDPGILGGIKFGRFFDKYPWLGVELDTNFSRNNVPRNSGKVTPPVPGGPAYLLENPDWFMIWATQVDLIVRYGFLQDKEVNFGRLQPYVGIGPGFEIIYAKHDSAKNFAFETMAGVRYLCTSKIALFFEYKFGYQFQVEYQNVTVSKSGQEGAGTLRMDVPHHRFVVGVSYHFKNLWGN
jgi:opacity protein-like surface antigen